MENENLKFDAAMKRFRIASRDIYNTYFYVQQAHLHVDEFANALDAFQRLEVSLFHALVSERFHLPRDSNGSSQSFIRVKLRHDETPVMMNREIDSGYWDYPIGQLAKDSPICFLSFFFDWDQQGYRDNQFVRGVITSDTTNRQQLMGKHVLIEALNVHFEIAR